MLHVVGAVSSALVKSYGKSDTHTHTHTHTYIYIYIFTIWLSQLLSYTHLPRLYSWPWTSYHIRKITGSACTENAGNVFPPSRVSDPDMYNGTFVTHVSWYMPGSLTSVFLWSRWQGKRSQNSRACATRNCMYLVRGPCISHVSFKCDVSVILILSDMSFTLFYFFSHPSMGSCYGMRMFTWWFNCNWYSTFYHTHRWAAAMACVCLHGDSTVIDVLLLITPIDGQLLWHAYVYMVIQLIPNSIAIIH